MARNHAPQEVIEISDGESASSVVGPPHTSSQARNAGTRNLNPSDVAKRSSLSANKKKAPLANDGVVERPSASSTPGSKHLTATGRPADATSRSSARDRDLPPLPIMTNGRARENKLLSNRSGHAPSRGALEPIVLSDDDDMAPKPSTKKQFVWPRGLSPSISNIASLEARGPPRQHHSRSSSPKKRSREHDSPLTNPSPPKKLKLSQLNGDGMAALKPRSIRNGEAPTSAPRAELPVGSTPTASKLSGWAGKVISATSSPQRRRSDAAGPSDDESNASSASGKVKSRSKRMAKGGTHRVSSPLRKRNYDKEDVPEEVSSVPKNASAVSNGKSTPRFGPVAESKQSPSVTERSRSKEGRTTNGDISALPLRGDLKPASTKRQTMSDSMTRQSPSPNKESYAEAIGETRAVKEGASRRSKFRDQAQDVTPHPSDLRNRLEPANSGKFTSTSTNGQRQIETLEDDQGYVSFGSGKGESPSRKQREKTSVRKDRLESASEEHRPRYEELPQPGVANETKPGLQEHSRKPADAQLRATRGSQDAAAVSKQDDHQNHLQTPDTELASAAEVQQRLSEHENYHVTESDEADLQPRSEALQGGAAEDIVMVDSESAFAQPTTAASALKTAALLPGLSLANRVERVLGGYMEELRGDNEYWTSVALRRARLSQEDDDDSTALANSRAKITEEEPTSFSCLKPLKFSPHKKGSATAKSDEIWGIQRMAQDGRPQGQMEVSATYTTFATDQQDVPDFAHYVSLQNNLLAPNVIHLHCWPYFGDDFDMSEAQNLSSQYNIDILSRERKILLLLQAQMHERYVESALQDLDCSFADVLRFLLEPDPDVGSDWEARRAYQNRGLYCQEDFSRKSDRWTAVLSRLPPSSPMQLGSVALLCENFQRMAKFSLWHIARKSSFASLPGEENQTTAALPADDELTCRICLRFNCPYHGQFKHRRDDDGDESDAESISSVDTVVATDIIHPLKVNYRSRITFMPDAAGTVEPETVVDPLLRRKQRDQNYWSGYRHKADERGPFYPCSHHGLSCNDANCSCFVKMIPCEKTCSCAPDCIRKFKGCSCGVRKGNQMVCAENPECVCWQNGRECDPDLCGSCGVCDVVDPVNKYDDRILIGHCRNASIQRGVPKHTLLGDSGVHGLGLYACEDIKHHHFVGEYKGEIITKKEADRRGAVYEHQKLSYLFSLNKSQEIDSTYFGNKVRFINHAHGEKANLYPRIIMVNTVHRIALYASKDIPAGKELLFDYGPLFPDEQLQSKKSKKSAPESKKSAPHVRNANLVKEFYDVSESEDEDGILRAKAVSRGRGRSGNKKARNGPRNGAGRKPHASSKPSRPDAVSKPTESERDKEQDAGARLAAFNISDDTPSEAVDLDAGIEEGEEDEEDDAAFEPEDSESVDSLAITEEERSESDDEDDDEDEDRDPVRRGRGRPRGGGMHTRRRGRR